MNTTVNPPRSEWPKLLARPVNDPRQMEENVSGILAEVRQKGDQAVRKYTKFFDRVELQDLLVEAQEVKAGGQQVSADLKEAIQMAASNIRKFHRCQEEASNVVETMPGVTCWRKSVPIEKVGLYIPGGTAPLFSTVLMLGIPAQLAGCKEIVLCTPPQADGTVNPAILYAAELVGCTKVFKIGGVQAIGALAYGTESVPRVDKIFGPGNQFVTVAKQLVNKEGIAIDMPAGPSEVLVMADGTCEPSFVAADLLSQAEHGADSQVILVTNSAELVAKIWTEVLAQLELLPRKEMATKALSNSRAIVMETEEEALGLINAYAPEHLIIAVENATKVAENITNAGSVFIGNFSPESVGDYASGTNHTLPTNGFARAYSGVSLDSFVKKITFQQLTSEGIRNIGPAVELMAEAEQLQAHKLAVTLRLEKLNNQS